MKHIPGALLIILLILVPGAVLWGQARDRQPDVINLTARMSEAGGWSQDAIDLRVGEEVTFRLTSADVVHGFAIGRTHGEAIDVLPAVWSEFTWTPAEAGEYTFYCTRWCGPNHWRMTGTLRVYDENGELPDPGPSAPPRYHQYGVDLDKRQILETAGEVTPSAIRGRQLGVTPTESWWHSEEVDLTTPGEAWQRLRRDPATAGLSDMQVWDLLAHLWRADEDQAALRRAGEIFQANCAACHGQAGAGDGVMAPHFSDPGVADFTDLSRMATANSVLLEGKILRGGMGTGMPYWGKILSEEQIDWLVDFLWSFSLPD